MHGVLPPTTRWLAQHLDEWVDAGIVDDSQRDAIAAYEHDRPSGAAAPRRLSIGAEVAAYLGSVLALTGGVVAVGESWEGLSFVARLALGLLIMGVGLAIGHWLFRFGEPGTDRLGGFVTMLGVAGLALSTGLIVDELELREGAWIPFAVGVAVLVASLALWRNRERPLQLVSSIVGFGVAATASTELLGQHWWICGLVFMGAGLLLSLLGHVTWAHPAWIAVAAGGVGTYVGAHMLADYNRHLGPAVALAVALVYVLYSVRVDLTPLLVLAILGATVASGALLSTTFDSALSALVIALIGLVLVGVVISRSTRAVQR